MPGVVVVMPVMVVRIAEPDSTGVEVKALRRRIIADACREPGQHDESPEEPHHDNIPPTPEKKRPTCYPFRQENGAGRRQTPEFVAGIDSRNVRRGFAGKV
jgi:hypothetical protein